MITLGGDAELELVDSLDPFSEGIVFSVRPPKKELEEHFKLVRRREDAQLPGPGVCVCVCVMFECVRACVRACVCFPIACVKLHHIP